MRVDAGARPAGHKAGGVARNARAAVFAAAVQTVAGLALYSYLIRVIGAAEVGLWITLLAAGLLACMADLGLNHALIRALPMAGRAGARCSPEETAETLVWAVALLTGLSLGVLQATFGLWSRWLSLSPQLHQQAWSLLPFITVGLWLNRVSDGLAGCLDGQERFVERSIAGAAGLALGLAVTVLLVPRFGLHGAAGAFVMQNLVILLANARLVRRGLPGVRWWRPRLRRAALSQGVSYGLSVLALVFCYLVLEAGTKLLLAANGFLSAASYFDMAFRIGKGVRGLLASAVRVLVPRMVVDQHQEGGRAAAYARSFAMVLLTALPVYVGLVAGADALSRAITGHSEPTFIAAVALVLAPWLAYSLLDPALNVAMAAGRMRWPMLGHALTVVTAVALVALPGVRGTAPGFFAVVGSSMLLGCAVALAGLHREHRLGWSIIDPWRTATAIVGGLAIALLGFFAPVVWPTLSAGVRWAVAGAAWVAYTAGLWAAHPAASASLLSSAGLSGRAPKSK